MIQIFMKWKNFWIGDHTYAMKFWAPVDRIHSDMFHWAMYSIHIIGKSISRKDVNKTNWFNQGNSFHVGGHVKLQLQINEPSFSSDSKILDRFKL